MRRRLFSAAFLLAAVMACAQEAAGLGAPGHYYTSVWIVRQIRSGAMPAPAVLQQALQYGPARDAFYGGSMFPDLVDPAESHQGNNGDLVKRMMDGATRDLDAATTPEERGRALTEVAFVYGWMTHMSADLTAHPLINATVGETYRYTDTSGKVEHAATEVAMDRAIFNMVDQSGSKSATVPHLEVPNAFIRGFVKTTTSLDDFVALRFEQAALTRMDPAEAQKIWKLLAEPIARQYVEMSRDWHGLLSYDLDTARITTRQYDEIRRHVAERNGGRDPRDMTETLQLVATEVNDLMLKVQGLFRAWSEAQPVVAQAAQLAEQAFNQEVQLRALLDRMKDAPGRNFKPLIEDMELLCASAQQAGTGDTVAVGDLRATAASAPGRIEAVRNQLAAFDKRRADVEKLAEQLTAAMRAKATVDVGDYAPAVLARKPGTPRGLVPFSTSDVELLRQRAGDLRALLQAKYADPIGASAAAMADNAENLLSQPWVGPLERGLDFGVFDRLEENSKLLAATMARARTELAAMQAAQQTYETATRALAEGQKCAERLRLLNVLLNAMAEPPSGTTEKPPPPATACAAACQKEYDRDAKAVAAHLSAQDYYKGLMSSNYFEKWNDTTQTCWVTLNTCQAKCPLGPGLQACNAACKAPFQQCCGAAALFNAQHALDVCIQQCPKEVPAAAGKKP